MAFFKIKDLIRSRNNDFLAPKSKLGYRNVSPFLHALIRFEKFQKMIIDSIYKTRKGITFVSVHYLTETIWCAKMQSQQEFLVGGLHPRSGLELLEKSLEI